MADRAEPFSFLTVQVISIAASTLFLLLLPFRLSNLRGETIKVVQGHRGYGKSTVAIVLSVVQSIALLTGAFSTAQSSTGFFSATASLVACIGLCPLLFFEHARSTRPSDLAIVYLLVSLACDSAELRTLAYHNAAQSAFVAAAASLCVKLVLLAVESRSKEDILRGPHDQWPPEQLAGILDRVFFWWINPILARGNRFVLTGDNLPLLDNNLLSGFRRHRALQAWDQRAKPETKTTLPKVLALSMLSPFLAPIVPRLFLIGFRYAQPILISTAIRYIGNLSGQSAEGGYSVILMAVVVYVGLAVSKAMYQHRLNRLKIMIRSAAVGLINNKSLQQQSSGHNDGRAVTLMSTDADNVCQVASMFHETWAQVIEVVLGMAMLSREVGWACLILLVIIFFCSRMSRYLAKNLQGRQKDWNAATQKRIAMTTSMLASMKSLKMLGMASYAESLVQKLRLQELQMSKKVRWMMVAYNASANALGIFSPIVTFVIFVLIASWNGSTLDTETAFTTTALLGLVTHPANMIMSIIPQAIGSLAAFERIQEYLLQSPRHDQRLTLKRVEDSTTDASDAISIRNVTIQTTATLPPLLWDINMAIKKGSIVVCSGPVGSGKTMLTRCLMGELPPASGAISVSSRRIGCCEQSPWLPNGTIKQAICAFEPENLTWYKEVIRLCCLDEDLLELPNGDHTMIGSRGLNLSGGQRQRVAIARAVYARCEIVLLDDSFSALDGKTESRMVENLFGEGGHFRKTGTTVFLVTNSATHFYFADWLVILRDGTISYQGTWTDLTQDTKHVVKLHINETQNGTSSEKPRLDKNLQSQSLKVAEASSDLNRATGDISLYGYYIRAVGLHNFLILLACTLSYSFFITFPQYWLQKWTEAPVSQTMFYVGGYLILSLMAWVSTNGSMWSTHILVAPESGAELHRRLLSTIVGFSQDMQLVDKHLPPAVLSISNLQTGLLFSAQKFMTLTLPVCVIIIYVVQKVYLRTSRQLRLLDLESQSAVYSSFLESVEGVATIRAFGWEKQVEHANIRCLDKSQQPAYILFCLQNWLSIVLDLMVAAIATGLITLAILIRGTTTAGQVGMALNIVLVANSTLLGLVTSWTSMEISLGAISRLKSLEAKTPREDKPSEDYVPEGAWPSSGAVQLSEVEVAYHSEAIALQDISLKVSAGQQLVVCGRTGSGKSTLLLALLRILDTTSGSIKVDGVDLSLVPRSLIRQRCFITISQDPFVLGQASLRFNLEPSGTVSDEMIVSVLQKTSLWSHLNPENPVPRKACQVLDSAVALLPQMSSGQSQLLAVARAILQLWSLHQARGYADSERIMPVLLLDEATSSLDPETETSIRNIIHEEFTEKGHTVIAITHRQSGLTDNMRKGQDVAVLLSKGRIQKFGGVEDVLGTSS
ncbi:atp-binding cassette [Colletotrichum incanum]|uniref:Atp-binding cassette n=1 Tax=Colletotrichum incanum TaxID=1573173 RepID=A0A161Y5K5_COLIC|nr:atp-binding cassette [Colletotrichum incanum]